MIIMRLIRVHAVRIISIIINIIYHFRYRLCVCNIDIVLSTAILCCAFANTYF